MPQALHETRSRSARRCTRNGGLKLRRRTVRELQFVPPALSRRAATITLISKHAVVHCSSGGGCCTRKVAAASQERTRARLHAARMTVHGQLAVPADSVRAHHVVEYLLAMVVSSSVRPCRELASQECANGLDGSAPQGISPGAGKHANNFYLAYWRAHSNCAGQRSLIWSVHVRPVTRVCCTQL